MNIETLYEVLKVECDNWSTKMIESDNKNKTHREKLHAIRLLMEPYIYNLLLFRYGSQLDEFWKTYLPPKKSDKAFVLVERRCHPNFWFVLRNMAWAGPNMSVYIFCSDINIDFIKSLLGDKVDYFNLIPVFKGSPPRNEAILEYSNFLTSYKLYEAIDAEWIITTQMDVFIRRKITDSMFVGDYWGYPFGWRPEYAGGGGATVRNVKRLYELCKKYRPEPDINEDICEDVWFCDKMLETNGFIPPFNFRKKYIMENVPSKDPYIIHQFWTYLDTNLNFNSDISKIYWNHILTFVDI